VIGPVGVTLGDPAGVGPEVVVKALAAGSRAARAVVIGDVEALRETVKRLRVRARVEPIEENDLCAGRWPRAGAGRVFPVLPVGRLSPRARRPGKPSLEGGRAAYHYVMTATRLARSGALSAIVTAPINKALVTRAGFPISGHTELLAEVTGARDVRMMLAGSRLRVVLVTMHVALADVPKRLTVSGILRTIRVTDEHLRRYHRLRRPRIAVAGLNPHAGEGGLFGREERTLIAPAVARARAAGVDAHGPFAADALFFHAVEGAFDAVVTMYHDQGLIPLKLLHFHDGVNVTMGLPIVRTSPDHGTAYEIAGKGTANDGSMRAAIALAIEMARSGTPPAAGRRGRKR